MTALLITGTDTDVGKTFITIALTRYWQKYRLNQNSDVQELLSIFKLIQTGTGDIELYSSLFADAQGIEIIAPLRFDAPLAPPIAAAKEGKIIALGKVWQEFTAATQKSDLVILESLGGLGSPVTAELTVGNIAADWRFPTVLVVPVKLGAIANTVANVALARSLNVDLRGIILNCSQPEAEGRMADLTPINLIQSLTQVPVIGTLPYVENLENNNLALTVANWDLELILPKPKSYSRNMSIGI